MLLAGKVAVISGAASPRGIGFATARLFAEQGAKVAILDNDGGAAQDAAERLGTEHRGFACDVTNPCELQGGCPWSPGSFGQVDVLVNNAGITQPVKTMDICADRPGMRVLDVNLRGVLYLSQALVPPMRERKQGSIACMSSVSAQRGGGIFGGPHYSAAKAGVLGLAKAMARELGPDGIRVNCVTPGLIQTDITGGKLTDEMRTRSSRASRSGPARQRRGCRRHLSVPRLRPVCLRHGRRHRCQRRHADPRLRTAPPAYDITMGGHSMETSGGAARRPVQRMSLAQRAYRIRRNALRDGRGQAGRLHRPGARCRRRAGRGLLSGPSLPAG